MFCDDHSQLCCTKCAFLNHSQCNKVTTISELTNTRSTDLQGLSVKLETVLGEIKSLQSNQEARGQSLQGTYKEHEAITIKQMLVSINTTLDAYGISSVSLSDENEQYIKEEMCSRVLSVLYNFDKSTVKELNEMKDEVISIKGSITSSIYKCNSLQNDLTQFYETIKKIGNTKELCLIASIKCEHKIQQALTVLGKSGKVFTVQGKSEHNVRIPSDSDPCYIKAVCVLPDGQVLVADSGNNKVKLLNQQYRVVSQWRVSAYLQDMYPITPSEVAVAVDDDDDNIHEIQFFTVTLSRLVRGRTIQLQHPCKGIAHHQGDLFITSGTELYMYSLSAKLFCKRYKDRSDKSTVYMCAVSPTGDKLYITHPSQHQLLTLARDGTVLATFTDQELQLPYGVHVTPEGQVLVCGYRSDTILQIDSEGRRKLATLATEERDGVGDHCQCATAAPHPQ